MSCIENLQGVLLPGDAVVLGGERYAVLEGMKLQILNQTKKQRRRDEKLCRQAKDACRAYRRSGSAAYK